ncbi:MAG: amino acid dehydrogenase [Gammaproteobacteria bacterium]|nr:amino acid dehydrogenase [Gammaproteobacteria bacterium]
MSVFENASFAEHDCVLHCRDRRAGLKAIIAIHDQTLGPALGGCRMWDYASDDEALTDVLRLSRGMTYKNAMAGLPLGGGKSVIIGRRTALDRRALWPAFGRFVETLAGRYWTAQDVGLEVEDILALGAATRFVAGVDRTTGRGHDPSPMTALGTFRGIQAAVHYRLGQDDLNGVRVMLQGLGHVGWSLAEHLHRAGASLLVSDIDETRMQRAVAVFGASAIAPDLVFDVEAEVYAPCALGATLNEQTIERLRTPVVAGAANNQLAVSEAGVWLQQKGILYAPDYVINAGGVIAVGIDAVPNADRATIRQRVLGIHDTLLEIFRKADAEGLATSTCADRIALARVEARRQHDSQAA